MQFKQVLMNILVSAVVAVVVSIIISKQLATLLHDHPEIGDRIMKIEQDDASQNAQITNIKQDDASQNARIAKIEQDDASQNARIAKIEQCTISHHEQESRKWRECVGKKLSEMKNNPSSLTEIPNCPYVKPKPCE